MSPLRVVAGLAIGLAMAFNVSAGEDVYAVEARLAEDGRLFGSPAIVAAANKRATVVVGGEDAYTLGVVVTPLADGNLKITLDLDSAHGHMAPTVVAEPAKTVSVSAGDLALTLVARPVDR